LPKVGKFIDSVRETAKVWMQLRGLTPAPHCYANWRESWNPSCVQVWGRIAPTKDDCEAINWLHKPYRRAIFQEDRDKRIKASSVTGKIGQIGRLWHRMYPRRLRIIKRDGKVMPKSTNDFLELLTIFPDDSQESKEFIEFLQSNSVDFKPIWGQE
jgi:CRISPR-associated protein Cmr6